MAQLLRDQALLAETTETVLVLPPPSWSDIPDGITLLGASPVGEGAAPLFVRTPLEETERAGRGADSRLTQPGRLGCAPGRG